MSVLAITGGTGFVGGALIERALAAGHRVHALTRREQPARDGVQWVRGDLSDHAALTELARGADAVVHVAGVVSAPDPAGFDAGNIAGTQVMLDAARAAGVRRFIHVSSLAAREPALSDYCRSKAGGEALAVAATDLDVTIVRPPAVYGPGDSEMRDLFRMAGYGIGLLPPKGRVSVIEVGDLARLLLLLATSSTGIGRIYEADDERPGGWSHAGFARAIGAAVGRERMLVIAMPRSVVRLGAGIDRLLRGSKAKLTPDRASYLSHPDWVISDDRRPPADLWRPEVPTLAGLRRTAQWYRARGLL